MLVAAAKILGGKRRAVQLAAEVRARAVAAIEEYIRRRWVNFIVRLEEERLGGREAPLGPLADDDSSDEVARTQRPARTPMAARTRGQQRQKQGRQEWQGQKQERRERLPEHFLEPMFISVLLRLCADGSISNDMVELLQPTCKQVHTFFEDQSC